MNLESMGKMLLQMSAFAPSLFAEEEFYLLHEDHCVCCLVHLVIDSKELYSLLTDYAEHSSRFETAASQITCCLPSSVQEHSDHV